MTASLLAKKHPILSSMPVLDSRGNRVGVVDQVVKEGEIKLSRSAAPDGLHYIPLDWVAEVDSAVRLNKCCAEIYRDRG